MGFSLGSIANMIGRNTGAAMHGGGFGGGMKGIGESMMRWHSFNNGQGKHPWKMPGGPQAGGAPMQDWIGAGRQTQAQPQPLPVTPPVAFAPPPIQQVQQRYAPDAITSSPLGPVQLDPAKRQQLLSNWGTLFQ